MNEEQQFFLLDYTHQKLRELLEKLDENMMLTQEQYDKLINKIGLDNISTFSRNYYDLLNTPIIPTKTSQLMNDSGLLDLYHYESINEQIGVLVNRIGELEPRVEELEAIPDIIYEVNEIEERIANIQEDIVNLQEFCNDYKIDFENLYDITMEIKKINDSLEDRLIYTNEKINLCIDLVDLNTTDISTLTGEIIDIHSQIESIKMAKEDLENRANRFEEAIDLLDVPDLRSRVESLEYQFENVCLDKYATEESVVAFLNRASQIYQEYSKIVVDLNQLENRMGILAEAAQSANNNLNKVSDNVDQNTAEIAALKSTVRLVERTVANLSDVDVFLIEELNKKAEDLEVNLSVIQEKINAIEGLDFINEDDLKTWTDLFNNEIHAANQNINNMNLQLLRLTAIDHSAFATEEALTLLKSNFEVHNSKANNQINEINAKLARFENLDINTIATIPYVDSKATDFTNAINDTNKRIDSTNYKIDLLTVALETLEENYNKNMAEANAKMVLIDNAIVDFNNKYADVQSALLAIQTEMVTIRTRLNALEQANNN